MKKLNLNEEFIKMQKVAGLITESNDDIFNNQYSVSDENYEKMDNLVNKNDLDKFMTSAASIMKSLTDEGFEVKDIFYYLYTRLTSEI